MEFKAGLLSALEDGGRRSKQFKTQNDHASRRKEGYPEPWVSALTHSTEHQLLRPKLSEMMLLKPSVSN